MSRHAQGDLRRAEEEYRRVLASDAGCHEALHGLGLVMHQCGRHELAVSMIEKALELCPDRSDYHYHMAEVLRTGGHCREAIPEYRQAIRLAGTEADYYFGLGNALAEQGSDTECIEAYQNALRLAPEDAEIHNNLGNSLAGIGDTNAAMEHLRKAVTLDPAYVDAHHNLALVLKETGDAAMAMTHAREASKRASHDPALLATIAECLRSAGNPAAAVDVYRAATGKEPDNPEHRAGLCHCLIQLHRFADAEAESRRALEVETEYPPALGTLAVCLQTRGQFDEAVALLRRALELDPRLTETAYLLAANGGYEVSNGELGRWLDLLENPDLPREKRFHLHFAVAKVYERRRRYDTAFSHFQQANRTKARLYPFDARRHREYVTRIMATFTPEFFEQRPDYGVADDGPVFIVGMPRSGSTLVEQILSRHRDVAAMGEHPEMRQIMRELPGLIDNGQPAPECCRALSAEKSRQLARRYLASRPEAAANAARVSDKMLGNFLRLGIIALLFPRARVVHCVRNPLDTCVSCFTQDFAQGLRFTTDLSNLALFYRSYRALMAHWRRVLPLSILEVPYESLVKNPERVARNLIEFCDLPWDERCLSPHLGRREVATASVWQARQPVYTNSIARWRRYEAHLGPLFDGLQEAGVDDVG